MSLSPLTVPPESIPIIFEPQAGSQDEHKAETDSDGGSVYTVGGAKTLGDNSGNEVQTIMLWIKCLCSNCLSAPCQHVSDWAVIPLPETYEEALSQAYAIFSRQGLRCRLRTDKAVSPQTARLTLRMQFQNFTADGTTSVWASIEPSTWKIVVKPCSLISVCQGSCDSDLDPRYKFMHGHVRLSFGLRDGQRTRWTRVEGDEDDDVIDRPTSFEHACHLVRERLKNTKSTKEKPSNSSWLLRFLSHLKSKPEDKLRTLRNRDLSSSNITFYTLNYPIVANKEPDRWCAFPLEAYENEETWRHLVPEPNQFLGVMIAS